MNGISGSMNHQSRRCVSPKPRGTILTGTTSIKPPSMPFVIRDSLVNRDSPHHQIQSRTTNRSSQMLLWESRERRLCALVDDPQIPLHRIGADDVRMLLPLR